MTWSQRRKLIYFGIVTGTLTLAIGVPTFFIVYEKPTCLDGKQNQNEQGVDCGGSCIRLCKALQLQPVVRWSQTFKVTEKVYTATAYIQNANLKAEAFDVPFTFTIYDAQNKVVATRTGKTYIPPGMNFAIVETGLLIENAIPARTLFEFGEEFNWKISAPNRPKVVVKDQLWSNVDLSPLITAELVNQTFNDINDVKVTVIVYDDEKNAFAASRTVVNYLKRESQEQIVFTWPVPFPKAISNIEIIPIPQ